jgi:hypothetical protein
MLQSEFWAFDCKGGAGGERQLSNLDPWWKEREPVDAPQGSRALTRTFRSPRRSINSRPLRLACSKWIPRRPTVPLSLQTWAAPEAWSARDFGYEARWPRAKGHRRVPT